MISTSPAGQQVITAHHVLTGSRDSDLFDEALEAIVAAKPADWRTIALSMRGWDDPSMTVVQRHIVRESGESDADAVRRGRWMNLGTSIHEMLHGITSPDFERAIRALEEADLGVEGFTEFFTRMIYKDLVDRAAGDDALRAHIEGVAAPPFTPPARHSYDDFFATVTILFTDHLGSNLENMKQAYLGGHVEYLGLGRWNEILNKKRANEIGAAVMLAATGGSLDPAKQLVRVTYGRLLWGHNGNVQVDLRAGGSLTYLGQGSRLGIGPQASLTVRGAHLFLTGGASFEASVAASGGLSPQLDAALRLEAGVRIGRFQVGPQVHVLIPVTDTQAADRGVRTFAGIGASFLFGP